MYACFTDTMYVQDYDRTVSRDTRVERDSKKKEEGGFRGTVSDHGAKRKMSLNLSGLRT